MTGWKTYVVGILLALNSGLYTTGVYTNWLGSPGDKNLHDAVMGILMGGGFAALRMGQTTEAVKVENVVSGRTAPRKNPTDIDVG